MADAELLAAVLAPVPGPAPAGRDLRYDPRYDALREARREDADLPQGGLAVERKLADWPRVAKDAATLLATASKDLQIAAWLTEALLRRDGLRGLETGLIALGGLLDAFWDGLYPELDDGDAELRLGPLDWVGARLDLAVRQSAVARDGLSLLAHEVSRSVPTEEAARDDKEKATAREAALAEGKPSPEAADASVAATPKAFYKELVAAGGGVTAALDTLERAGEARFGGDPPSYRGLRLALADLQRFAAATLARKLEQDPDPVEPLAPVDVGTYAPPSAADASGTLAAEPASAADAAARVAGAARFLRQQDPTAPASYLLLRGLRWGELRGNDGAGANGAGANGAGAPDPRLLEAPPTAVRTRLKGLLLDARWPELLEQGELVMATPAGRGWLDLQRYALTACARLGAPYDAVATAVSSELATLLTAVPGLPAMTLMDDTPTANDETRRWLDALLDGGAAQHGAEHPDADGGEDARLPDGSDALLIALDAEMDGDALAATARGGAARRSTGGHAAHHVGAQGDARVAADAFALARLELARGRPNRAVELLVAELDRERSARGRFVRQTQVAQVMVEAGFEAVARPILQRLVQTIDERTLEDWESGPLVAQPMVLMCRVIDRLELDADEREQLYLRVCRLDPLQALALRRDA